MLIKREIDGVTYTAKYSGYKYATEFYDDCKDAFGNVMQLKVAEKVFSTIIVEPKVNADSFDSMETLFRVIDFGINVAVNAGEKKRTKSELQIAVEDKWAAYRLVFSDVSNISYEDVFFRMTPQEIAEANIALDKVLKMIEEQGNA